MAKPSPIFYARAATGRSELLAVAATRKSGLSDMRPSAILIPCFLALLGCSPYVVSGAFLEPARGWSSEGAGRGQRLIGPEVEIYVRAGNLVSSGVDETKDVDFGVSLYFQPKADGLEFDPAEVSLLIPGTSPLTPIAFEAKNAGYTPGDRSCARYDGKSADANGRYKIVRGLCFDFHFAVAPPGPDAQFTLHVPPLASSTGFVQVPDIRFRKLKGAILFLP
jgi:hypothetical protein